VGRSWQSPLLGALTIDYRGSRFVLGRTSEHYAIWDTTSGSAPSLTFSLSSEGWTEAWRTFRAWEPGQVTPGGQPAEWGPSPTAGWVKGQPLALGPMRAGQILDGVFRLYRMYFGTFVPIVAFVILPVQAVFLVLNLATLEPVELAPGFVSEQPATWVTILTSVVQFFFVTPFLTGAIVRAAADAYLGRQPTVFGSYRTALPKIHSILWVTILTLLAVIVWFIPAFGVLAPAMFGQASPETVFGAVFLFIVLGLVPAIFFYLRFAFATSIVVVEDIRGTKAMGRSWRLVRGLTWKVLGVTLLAGLIMIALFLVVGLLFAAISIPFLQGSIEAGQGPGPGFFALNTAVSAIATTLVTPVFTLVTVLLYFDARIRKEGFDLAVMAEQLGRPAAGASGSLAPGG
jgi:hypothetical protein